MKKLLLGLALLGTLATASAYTTAWISPTGPGTYTEWSPSESAPNYTLVDETPCNGNVDYVTTNTTRARDSYTIPLSSIPDGSIITAVYIAPCALQNVATTTRSSIAMFDRINGVDSAWAGTYLLSGTTTPSPYSYAYIAVPSVVKSSSTQIEIGAVLTAGGIGAGGGGARLSRLAAVVAYNPPLIIPIAPSNLTASQNSSNTLVTLEWSDNSSNERGFVIERSTNGTTFSALTYVAADTSRYSISTQTAGTYYYRVRAYSTNAYSGYSNTASTTVTLPVSPSNLAAFASTSATGVVVTWKDNSSDETSFVLEKSSNGTTFTTLATLLANTVLYADNNLTPGTYYYRVRAYSAAGYSLYSNVASITLLPVLTLPAAPSGMGASTASNTPLVYWNDNSNNEDGFAVEKSTDGINFSFYGTTTASYFIETNTTAGTYYYRVRAYNSIGFSAYSNVAVISIVSSLPAPSAITAGVFNSSSVGITWTDNSSDELGFLLERSANGTSTWVQFATTTANSNLFSDNNLTVGTYYYRVRAYNALGYSAYSLPSLPVSVVPPVAPSAITAGVYNSSSVGITWTDNSSDELGFLLERSANGTSTWVQFATTTANSNLFSDSGLTVGTYYYRVRAYNALGYSAYSIPSLPVSVVPPVAPSNLTAGLYNSNSIGLSWLDNSSDELGFLLERSHDGTIWVQFATSTTAFLSDDNLPPALYVYRVRAYNALGYSTYSGTSTAIFIQSTTTTP